MGAYLSAPKTDKVSENGEGNRLAFGASSMQGWRVSQEDSHNAILDFDSNASLFGVYDGHGGSEIAIYLSKHLPEFLKKQKEYQNAQDIKKALHNTFVSIDESIKVQEVLQEIQAIAKGCNENKSEEAPTLGLDYEEENVCALYEEATMPLESLVAKYQAGKEAMVNSPDEAAGEAAEEKPCSSKSLFPNSTLSQKTDADENTKLPNGKENDNETKQGNSDVSLAKNQSVPPENGEVSNTQENGKVKAETSEQSEDGSADPHCNQLLNSSNKNGEKSDKTTSNEFVADTKEEGGSCTEDEASTMETLGSLSKKEARLKRKAALYQAILSRMGCDSDSSDGEEEEDDSFCLPKDKELGDTGDESSDEADELDNSETSDEVGEEEEELDDDEDDDFLNDVQEPGFDSGSTANVALFKWDSDILHLWVANAGDSRCVVSRNGKAVEMSEDHKPESDIEAARIVKAGGKVTTDGRVNGGLNLSRAIGDHSYKLNSNLSLEEQMITPVPDVEYVTLDPKTDEFVVLACDGIWNSKSSQEVVQFISQRLDNSAKLSDICEELFESCLANDTAGDGTGCDNMTAIIIRLPHSKTGKRALSPIQKNEASTEDVKRARLDADIPTETAG